MATKRWRPRICRECGSIVKVYRFPLLSYAINWCRNCQRRLWQGDWVWEDR